MNDKQLNMRLSNELFNMLVLKANAVNKSNSNYIRELISNNEVKEDNSKDIAKLIGTINRVGNNVNQIAHNLNIAKQNNKLDDVKYEDILNQLILIENSLSDLQYD